MIINGLHDLFAYMEKDTSPGWPTSKKRIRIFEIIESILGHQLASAKSGLLVRQGRARLCTGTRGDMIAIRRKFDKEMPEAYCEVKPHEAIIHFWEELIAE